MRLLLFSLFLSACATHQMVQTDFQYFSGLQKKWFSCKGAGTARTCYETPSSEPVVFDEKILIPAAAFEELLDNQINPTF